MWCDTIRKLCKQAVLQNEADYGIALDGDGDRLMMVDRNGKVYDGDSLIYVIAKARAHEGVEIGGVVGTVMTNMAMEIALKEQGVDFCRAKVGDRYVLEQLHQRGWLIGGEASGHILCMDKHNTGDGIISALQVLAALQTLNQDLATVCADWQPYPQTMINVRIKKGQNWQDASKEALAEVEKELESKRPRGLACIWYRACRARDGGSQAGRLGEKRRRKKLPLPFKVKNNSVFDFELN